MLVSTAAAVKHTTHKLHTLPTGTQPRSITSQVQRLHKSLVRGCCNLPAHAHNRSRHLHTPNMPGQCSPAASNASGHRQLGRHAPATHSAPSAGLFEHTRPHCTTLHQPHCLPRPRSDAWAVRATAYTGTSGRSTPSHQQQVQDRPPGLCLSGRTLLPNTPPGLRAQALLAVACCTSNYYCLQPSGLDRQGHTHDLGLKPA